MYTTTIDEGTTTSYFAKGISYVNPDTTYMFTDTLRNGTYRLFASDGKKILFGVKGADLRCGIITDVKVVSEGKNVKTIDATNIDTDNPQDLTLDILKEYIPRTHKVTYISSYCQGMGSSIVYKINAIDTAAVLSLHIQITSYVALINGKIVELVVCGHNHSEEARTLMMTFDNNLKRTRIVNMCGHTSVMSYLSEINGEYYHETQYMVNVNTRRIDQRAAKAILTAEMHSTVTLNPIDPMFVLNGICKLKASNLCGRVVLINNTNIYVFMQYDKLGKIESINPIYNYSGTNVCMRERFYSELFKGSISDHDLMQEVMLDIYNNGVMDVTDIINTYIIDNNYKVFNGNNDCISSHVDYDNYIIKLSDGDKYVLLIDLVNNPDYETIVDKAKKDKHHDIIIKHNITVDIATLIKEYTISSPRVLIG